MPKQGSARLTFHGTFSQTFHIGMVKARMSRENHIIQAVLAGQTAAFRALIDLYQQPIHRMIHLMISDPTAAEDLTQETFLRAYRRLAQFDPARGPFRSWLYAIARNQVRAHFRQSLPHTASLEAEPERAESLITWPQESFEDFRQLLDQALRQLPAAQRQTFILAEIEELPQAEIARIEECEIGTVKSRLNRAKEQLRAALRAYKESRR